jgi:2',3'-cyclic-nucleotide 2'-phosphodiesterase (5'-nucleotidase family)
VTVWVLLFWLSAAAFSCDKQPKQPAEPVQPKADVRLLVLTDPKGYLEPCGCQQRPLGGLDKLATLLKQERADGTPTLLLAAGDLTYGVELRPEDAENARRQEKWRAETLVDIWSRLGMSAATPGPLDFVPADSERKALMERSKFPWLLENAVDGEGKPLAGFARARIVQAGAVKVGLFGLVAPNPSLRLPQGASLDADLAGTAKRTTEALRAQGATLVVALLNADRRTAREVAAQGPDVVVMGGLDTEEPFAPSVHGNAVLVHAGYQGQRLLTLDLELGASGEWHDASRWTRDAHKKDLEDEIKALSAKIAAWEKDPKVQPGDLATQRASLKRLQDQAGAPSTVSFSGRWFNAKAIELAPEVAVDKAIGAQLDAYDKRVNEANARTPVPPLPAPAGTPHYVGSESCKGCHEAAYAWWRGTKHGHAYNTLVERNKQFDLSCVGCHVVGYNKPGGSTVTHVEKLKDVGCENCHGPGEFHNKEPEKPGLVVTMTPESVCASCHTHEHSSRFQFAAFSALLKAPGHGLPAEKTQ